MRLLILITLGLALSGCARTPPPYPLTTCIVSGHPLTIEGEPIVFQHEGREVRLCCKECVGTFHEDPQKFMARLPSRAAP